MRIVVDFRNPGNGYITVWQKVSFTYIVISRNLNGAYSDIWATVGETTTTTTGTDAAIDVIGAGYVSATTPVGGGDCKVYTDPKVTYDHTATAPCDTVIAKADGTAGGSLVVHAYIMGFRYNPVQSTTRYLYAGVKPISSTMTYATD